MTRVLRVPAPVLVSCSTSTHSLLKCTGAWWGGLYSVTAHLALLGRGEGGGRERSLARPGRSCARCRHPWPGPGEHPRSFSFSFSFSLYQSGRSSRSSDLLILSWGLRVPWQGSWVATDIY